jgi:hypothetical protein
MPLIQIAKQLADDFTNGTQHINALVGFANVFVLLSIWQERIGIESKLLFGSSIITYGIIILLVGHYSRLAKEKIVKK